MQDKTALVTASTSGLGRATAIALAEEGATVIICGRDQKRLEETRTALTARSHNVYSIDCDLTAGEGIDRLFDYIDSLGLSIDILVANTGGPPAGFFADFGDDDWQAAFETTFLPQVRLIRRVLPAMKEHRYGRILAVTSVAVKQPIDNLILSNAMRSAVHGMLKTLATELAPFGITVNALLPGLTRTPRLENLAAARAEPTGKDPVDVLEEMGKALPAGRLAEAEEFAALAAFLASEKASYITGQSIAVDGGLIKGLFG